MSEAPALCVAVNGDCVAVGYHGDGIKLFSLESGEFKLHVYIKLNCGTAPI